MGYEKQEKPLTNAKASHVAQPLYSKGVGGQDSPMEMTGVGASQWAGLIRRAGFDAISRDIHNPRHWFFRSRAF